MKNDQSIASKTLKKVILHQVDKNLPNRDIWALVPF